MGIGKRKKRKICLMVLLVYIHFYYNGYWQEKKTKDLFDGITCLYTSLLQWVLAREKNERFV